MSGDTPYVKTCIVPVDDGQMFFSAAYDDIHVQNAAPGDEEPTYIVQFRDAADGHDIGWIPLFKSGDKHSVVLKSCIPQLPVTCRPMHEVDAFRRRRNSSRAKQSCFVRSFSVNSPTDTVSMDSGIFSPTESRPSVSAQALDTVPKEPFHPDVLQRSAVDKHYTEILDLAGKRWALLATQGRRPSPSDAGFMELMLCLIAQCKTLGDLGDSRLVNEWINMEANAFVCGKFNFLAYLFYGEDMGAMEPWSLPHLLQTRSLILKGGRVVGLYSSVNGSTAGLKFTDAEAIQKDEQLLTALQKECINTFKQRMRMFLVDARASVMPSVRRIPAFRFPLTREEAVVLGGDNCTLPMALYLGMNDKLRRPCMGNLPIIRDLVQSAFYHDARFSAIIPRSIRALLQSKSIPLCMYNRYMNRWPRHGNGRVVLYHFLAELTGNNHREIIAYLEPFARTARGDAKHREKWAADQRDIKLACRKTGPHYAMWTCRKTIQNKACPFSHGNRHAAVEGCARRCAQAMGITDVEDLACVGRFATDNVATPTSMAKFAVSAKNKRKRKRE